MDLVAEKLETGEGALIRRSGLAIGLADRQVAVCEDILAPAFHRREPGGYSSGLKFVSAGRSRSW